MNMIKRDPALFDVFNAFADDARLARISLHEPKAVEDFIDRIRTKLASALTDDKFLHGQRTQSMFLVHNQAAWFAAGLLPCRVVGGLTRWG